jgi:protein phosphatase
MMQLNSWCLTDKGLRRDSNQDAFLINKDLGLYIVADGMGGHSGGEVASALAVKTVEEFIKKNKNSSMPSRELIYQAYVAASRRVYEQASQQSHLVGMGTTMVLCYYDGTSIFIGNVGDSRVYLFRKPSLWQVTEDHSLLNEQLRAGIINEDQIKTFTSKNVITRSVGYEKEVVVDVLERVVSPGDAFLLCSDGLSGLVPDATISEVLNRTASEKIVNACVERALAHGGDDNVTVMYLEVV